MHESSTAQPIRRRFARGRLITATILGAAIFGAAFTACGSDSDGKQVNVKGLEYGFEAPTSLKPGKTTFNFENIGKEEHEMALVRLKDGATIEQALGAESDEDRARLMDGGPAVVIAEPGQKGTASIALDLKKGTYALVCTFTLPDGSPHAAHGMVRSISVS